ncbi:hypothetical protein YC2023_087695 [Brassica napus]|uniref:Uncharacterized protein n=2 Tax=Brassica oleracea TaxID=3712 RepID=A0A0D3DGN2_BRAOL|nr:unnamed protein product [Brassica oleracea]
MEKSISSSSTLKVTCLANKTSLWKIRKILTEKSEGWLDFDNNSDVEKYLFSHLSKSMINVVKKDPTKIKIDDYDTGYQQERLKELGVGDEVGFFYDPLAKSVCFSVLKQAKP